MLYIKNNSYPQELPFRIVLSNGLTRTDPGTFTPEEIADAGYIQVPDKPAVTSTQHLNWDYDLHQWTITDFTQEELDNIEYKQYLGDLETWKANRELEVKNIEVTYNSVIYQGDEISQGRMARSIVALPDDITTIPWTAKDNTVHNLTRVDLQSILLNAGTQQAALWNTGRPVDPSI